MAFIGPIEDRLAIRELSGAYGYASASADCDGWLACWAPACRWITVLGDVSGKPALRRQWQSLWADWVCVAFSAEIGSIEVDGDTARVLATTSETVLLNSGGLFKLAGLYEDRLVKHQGAWLYTERRHSALFSESGTANPRAVA